MQIARRIRDTKQIHTTVVCQQTCGKASPGRGRGQGRGQDAADVGGDGKGRQAHPDPQRLFRPHGQAPIIARPAPGLRRGAAIRLPLSDLGRLVAASLLLDLLAEGAQTLVPALHKALPGLALAALGARLLLRWRLREGRLREARPHRRSRPCQAEIWWEHDWMRQRFCENLMASSTTRRGI